jgi:hypothetical protein
LAIEELTVFGVFFAEECTEVSPPSFWTVNLPEMALLATFALDFFSMLASFMQRNAHSPYENQARWVAPLPEIKSKTPGIA